jgi:hypothetical protein
MHIQSRLSVLACSIIHVPLLLGTGAVQVRGNENQHKKAPTCTHMNKFGREKVG